MRPIQFFSDEYLETTKKASPTQIATFLDEYRSLHHNAKLRANHGPTKLISIRLPTKILSELKALSRAKQVPYQTLMKQMIEKCLKGSASNTV